MISRRRFLTTAGVAILVAPLAAAAPVGWEAPCTMDNEALQPIDGAGG